MKKFLQCLTLGILMSFSFVLSAYSQQLAESDKLSVHAELKNKDATLLWGDNWNPGTSSTTIVSTYFGQLDPPLTLAADDFHITAEGGWDITSFSTRGTYLGTNDGDGFGFRIYADDNGQPGDLLHDTLFEEDFDISDVIEIDLEEPLHLEQGSYWLGIYGYFPQSADGADGRFGQYIWNPSPPVNENAMIRDYSDLFGLAGDGWQELVNLGISFTGLDFAIWGTANDTEMLWEYNWNLGTSSNTIVSTYFGQLDPPLTLAADDFHITAEDGWDITSFWTRGTYLGANDGDGFGFRIYADDNGQPGDLLHDTLFEEDFDINDVVEINLEEPLHLEQGSYWLGIYGYFPQSADGADGRFGQNLWNPSPPVNENAMIRDYSDLFGLAGDGWQELVNLGISFTGLDFAILGIAVEPEFAEVTFNVTDESGVPVDGAVISLGELVNEPGDYVFNDVPVGTHEYSISQLCYIDEEGEVLVQDDMTHEVEISYNQKPGDINMDGLVDVQDVSMIGDYFLDENSTVLCLLNADVNGDDAINILDLIAIVNVISGNEFSDPGTVTDADGNDYVTYIIGDQEWMAENLIVTSYNNGEAISTDLDDSQWSTTTQGAYAIYDHEAPNTDGINSPEEMVAAYGKLYNWYAVTDPRGLCPDGWHVPSDAEWTQLTDHLASQGFPNENSFSGAGRALKSCRQVNSPLGGSCATSVHPRWNSSNSVFGFNEYGFSVLPGGYRYKEGSYNAVGSMSIIWSSTNYSSDQAWMRFMFNNSSALPNSPDWKRSGFSVRCVREVE